MATPETVKLLARALEDAHAIQTEALEMLTALAQTEKGPSSDRRLSGTMQKRSSCAAEWRRACASVARARRGARSARRSSRRR